MVESNEWHRGYPASNVLVDSCDDADTSHAVGDVTWWVAPERATGAEADFILQLGCDTMVDRVIIKNSANGAAQDR